MSSRERFEAWLASQNLQFAGVNEWYWTIWQARDAEVERLVGALRTAKELMPKAWPTYKRIDALLREYDK